jgi:hypothetical protein
MLYSEIVIVCSEVCKNHKNAPREKMHRFLMLKVLICMVTTGSQNVIFKEGDDTNLKL